MSQGLNPIFISQEIDLTNESFNNIPFDLCLVKAFGYEIKFHDISLFTSGAKLYDKIVNFYIRFICNSIEDRDFVCVDSIHLNKILSSDHCDISKCLEKYSQNDFKFLFFPIYRNSNHWSLVYYDSVSKKVFLF